MSRRRQQGDRGQPPTRTGLRRAVLTACLALALSATGCAKGTYLEVRFTGPADLDIYGLRVALTLTPPTDAGGHSIGTVDSGTIIRLPTSMAFQLDDETGSLQVEASALDATGAEIASASGVTTIMRAKTWTLELNLAR